MTCHTLIFERSDLWSELLDPKDLSSHSVSEHWVNEHMNRCCRHRASITQENLVSGMNCSSCLLIFVTNLVPYHHGSLTEFREMCISGEIRTVVCVVVGQASYLRGFAGYVHHTELAMWTQYSVFLCLWSSTSSHARTETYSSTRLKCCEISQWAAIKESKCQPTLLGAKSPTLQAALLPWEQETQVCVKDGVEWLTFLWNWIITKQVRKYSEVRLKRLHLSGERWTTNLFFSQIGARGTWKHETNDWQNG